MVSTAIIHYSVKLHKHTVFLQSAADLGIFLILASAHVRGNTKFTVHYSTFSHMSFQWDVTSISSVRMALVSPSESVQPKVSCL